MSEWPTCLPQRMKKSRRQVHCERTLQVSRLVDDESCQQQLNEANYNQFHDGGSHVSVKSSYIHQSAQYHVAVRSKACVDVTGEREFSAEPCITLCQFSCSNLSYIRREPKNHYDFPLQFIPPLTPAFQLLLRVHGGEGQLGSVCFVSLTTFLTVGARVFPAVKCAPK